MDIIFFIGRVIFGGFFLMNAYNHFTKRGMLEGYAASKGVANPSLAVFATGVLLVMGGLGVILGIFVEIALISIIAFLLVVSFKMHAYWKETDPAAKMADMVNFNKNMALVGAALIMLAIAPPWPISLS